MDIDPNSEDEILDFLSSNEPHAGVPLDDPQYLLFQKYDNADKSELSHDTVVCESRAIDMGYSEYNVSIKNFNFYVVCDIQKGDVVARLLTPNVGNTYLDDLDFWLSMSEYYESISQVGVESLKKFFCEEMVIGMIRKNNTPTFTESVMERCDKPPSPQKLLSALSENVDEQIKNMPRDKVDQYSNMLSL